MQESVCVLKDERRCANEFVNLLDEVRKMTIDFEAVANSLKAFREDLIVIRDCL